MDDWPAVQSTPGHYVLTWNALPAAHVWIDLKDVFVPWNSNRYTLDFVIAQCYFNNTFTGDLIALNYHVSHWLPTDSARRHLLISIPGFGSVRRDNFDLPGQPDDYWLPPPAA